MLKTEETNKIIIEFEGKDTIEVRTIVTSQINSLFYLIKLLESKDQIVRGFKMELKEKIQQVFKEFDENEDMETYQALDKIREIVDFSRGKCFKKNGE